MKKFSILLLALAFAVAFAAPALAEDGFSVSGTYEIEGDQDTWGDYSDAYYTDDFELVLKVVKGAVTAVVDLEVSDTAQDTDWTTVADIGTTFGTGDWDSHSNIRNKAASQDMLDNYYVTVALTPAATLKVGEYAVHWGRKVALYNQGGHNIGLTYALDPVTLGLTIGKVEEGWDGEADVDEDHIVLSADFKKAGPFTKLAAYILYDNNEIAETAENMIGFDWAIPAGPVKLAGELAMQGGDNLEGNLFLIEAGLKDLVGFDLSANLLYVDEKFTQLGNDFAPLVVATDDLDGETNLMAIWFTGSYGINDKITLSGALAPYMVPVDEDVALVDDYGMEIDVGGTYKIADNATYDLGFGYYMPGEDISDDDFIQLYNKLTLKF